MILVVGATGLLGGEICRQLAAAGHPIRALVRPTSAPDRLEAVRATGADMVVGDLLDRSSLNAACAGVSAVVSTATTILSQRSSDSIAGVDEAGQLELIGAASAAGANQFIYLSVSANFDVESPLHTAKRRVEQALRASGVMYTILRPSAFMEVWLGPALGFDYLGRTATIYGDGERAISWISLNDVARFAVGCVDNPRAANATVELGGPEPLSGRDVVRIFEQVGGKPFATHIVSEMELEAQWSAAQAPVQKSFAALLLGLSRGDEIAVERAQRVFPVSLISVADYAAGVYQRDYKE
ncbi:MAG: SDR family oxidoreductase [Gemmatimonadaceae bacterium]